MTNGSVARRPDVTFLQTSDPHVYCEMLAHTSRTVKAFCSRNDYKYEAYIGLKRGCAAWHATYNRIFMLNELVDRGCRGWAIYLDADAFIPDQHFDLDQLLTEQADSLAIMTLAGVPQDWWDVNAGVLLMNLRHAATRNLIRRWRRLLDRMPDKRLVEAEMWAPGMDDQSFLQIALRQRSILQSRIHLASGEIINSPQASFIRQFIRLMGSIEQRTAAIEAEVNAVLAATS